MILKKVINKIFESYYYNCYENEKVNTKLCLFDSKNGMDLASNLFYLLKTLKEEHSDYKLVVVVKKNKILKNIRHRLESYGIKDVEIVKMKTFRYYKYLATAGYLFSDSTLPRIFTKRDEQIYLNTWHGTPLKMMGVDVPKEADDYSNVQRNLLIADILTFQSEYMKDKMLSAYMIDELYDGKILYKGYPRNSVYFDSTISKKVKDKLGITNKKLIVYMPTYRGSMNNVKNNKELNTVKTYLDELDIKLKDDEILYVKLHVFINDKLDYSNYSHIKPFPNEYEIYEFLSASDILITDYSSVLFDYAASKKKIILFTYDDTKYLNSRGMYLKLEDLPFPKVKNVNDLIKEIRTKKNYDDKKFIKTYNTNDSISSPKEIIDYLLSIDKIEKVKPTEKKNILVYCGKFSKNGIVTAFFNLFKNFDLDKYNIYVMLTKSELITSDYADKLRECGFKIIILTGRNLTFRNILPYFKFAKLNMCSLKIFNNLNSLFLREKKRIFGDVKYDCIIHYNGYHTFRTCMFNQFDCKKILFLHNDIYEEISKYKKRDFLATKFALNCYDKVYAVSEGTLDSVRPIAENCDNIEVLHNVCDYENIIENSKKDICFDEITECNVSLEKLNKILNSKSKKIINIGRFAPEKNQITIIEQFEKYNKEYNDSYLIIIGGYGKIYEEVKKRAETSSCSDKIIIIYSISNPMPILKKCDLFVLYSLIEAFPMTLMEADVLGVPFILSDCKGPYEFWSKQNAYIISLKEEDALYKALIDFNNNKIKALNLDYKEQNKIIIDTLEDEI